MKILRVAGVNLASLDEFDIDFRKVTSDRNRIFAIIGDTGAGKSTVGAQNTPLFVHGSGEKCRRCTKTPRFC